MPGVSQVLRIPGADQLSPQNDKLSQEIWSLGRNSRENPSALTDLDEEWGDGHCNCNNEEAKASQKNVFLVQKRFFEAEDICALLDKVVQLTEDGKLYRQCFHESPDSAADFQRADPHGDMAMGLWHSSNESRDCYLMILNASSRDLHLSTLFKVSQTSSLLGVWRLMCFIGKEMQHDWDELQTYTPYFLVWGSSAATGKHTTPTQWCWRDNEVKDRTERYR